MDQSHLVRGSDSGQASPPGHQEDSQGACSSPTHPYPFPEVGLLGQLPEASVIQELYGELCFSLGGEAECPRAHPP